jgi:hypothetical protein
MDDRGDGDRQPGEHQELAEIGYRPSVNQGRHEPLPASHDDERAQEAVTRNAEHSANAGSDDGSTPDAAPTPRAPDGGFAPGAPSAVDTRPAGGPASGPAPAAPGRAARHIMPGPAPQGDVPDAPGVQVTAVERDEQGRIVRVRGVANAAPGKPDGEVDTRS